MPTEPGLRPTAPFLPEGEAIFVRERIAAKSPRFTARVAGILYLVNFLTAPVVYYDHSHPRRAFAFGLLATASYVAVTILF